MPVNQQDVIEAAEALDFPTEGKFAEQLWRLGSSMFGLPIEDAKQLYRDCGYIPFSGYPLARSGKIPRMSRQQVAQAFESNPILLQLAKEGEGY